MGHILADVRKTAQKTEAQIKAGGIKAGQIWRASDTGMWWFRSVDGSAYIEMGANALEIQGVPVSSTTPTDGQELRYNGTSGQYEPVDANVQYPYDDVKDPTGFVDTQIDVSYDSTTRKVTLNDSGTHLVKLLWRGEEVAEFVDGWESPAHDVPVGQEEFFLYYNGTTTAWYSTVWEFTDAPIAMVYRDGANFCLRECHGCNMDSDTHREAHNTIGTYLDPKVAGGFSNYALDSTTATDRRPHIEAHKIWDEDIPTELSAVTNDLYAWLEQGGAATGVTIVGSLNGTYDSTYTDSGTTDTVNGLPVYTDGTNRIIRDGTNNYWCIDGGTSTTTPNFFDTEYYNLTGNLDGIYTGIGANAGVNASGTIATGSATTISVDNSEIIDVDGTSGRFIWNEFSGGSWGDTVASNNQYAKIFVVALPVTSDAECQKARYLLVKPQQASTNLDEILAIQPASVEFGSIQSALQEYVFIGEIIIQATASNWKITQVNQILGSRLNQISRPNVELQDLQSVTDVGSTTSNTITVNDGTDVSVLSASRVTTRNSAATQQTYIDHAAGYFQTDTTATKAVSIDLDDFTVTSASDYTMQNSGAGEILIPSLKTRTSFNLTEGTNITITQASFATYTDVELGRLVVASATISAGSTIFTLPSSDYYPATTKYFDLIDSSTGTRYTVAVNSSGVGQAYAVDLPAGTYAIGTSKYSRV